MMTTKMRSAPFKQLTGVLQSRWVSKRYTPVNEEEIVGEEEEEEETTIWAIQKRGREILVTAFVRCGIPPRS